MIHINSKQFNPDKENQEMALWHEWWMWCMPLRSACARKRTFLWMCVVLIGFSVRQDLWGVTSMVRALGLTAPCYDRMLDFFHSSALDVKMLAHLWAVRILAHHPHLVRFQGKPVLVGDGIKVGKAGKKMPGVKRLHQQSESNTKPTYILGHSCQAAGILARGMNSVVCIPLIARIHEGVVFSNRDKRTLLDKMMDMLNSLKLGKSFYFVADAYYASRKIIVPLLEKGCHLITRVRSNAVAYLPAPQTNTGKRGRPKVYGEKVKLNTLFERDDLMQTIPSPVYGEKDVQLCVWACDLLWRPVGILVRFVTIAHPSRGKVILMSTDLSLSPSQIIELYGYRFKIEVSFKSALHVVGAFLYHFWMKNMTPITKKGKDQYMHRESPAYRDDVRRKLDAYHRFIQLGLIAQGILCVLATTVPELVFASFASYFRTIRPGIAPSEAMVAISLQNTLPNLFADNFSEPILTKFLRERLDLSQTKAKGLAA
jgi:hypothetical protein